MIYFSDSEFNEVIFFLFHRRINTESNLHESILKWVELKNNELSQEMF